MSRRFEELAWNDTPMGEISLRRRRDPQLDVDVIEVKLGEEYLMSSLFTASEEALADLGLAACTGPEFDRELDVVVGGLGLGYTAHRALADDRIRSLVVVEALAEVVDWHRRDLVPGGADLTTDPRTTVVTGDFFALVRDGNGFLPADENTAAQRFHAILVDIDHTPRHTLHPSHADLYTPAGLTRVAELLHPGGVFGLWSDDPPDEELLADLHEVWTEVDAHVVTFANPLTRGESSCTVYAARTAT